MYICNDAPRYLRDNHSIIIMEMTIDELNKRRSCKGYLGIFQDDSFTECIKSFQSIVNAVFLSIEVVNIEYSLAKHRNVNEEWGVSYYQPQAM